MLREKIKETNVLSSNKWQISKTMPLGHILTLSDCGSLSISRCMCGISEIKTKKIIQGENLQVLAPTTLC